MLICFYLNKALLVNISNFWAQFEVLWFFKTVLPHSILKILSLSLFMSGNIRPSCSSFIIHTYSGDFDHSLRPKSKCNFLFGDSYFEMVTYETDISSTDWASADLLVILITIIQQHRFLKCTFYCILIHCKICEVLETDIRPFILQMEFAVVFCIGLQSIHYTYCTKCNLLQH